MSIDNMYGLKNIFLDERTGSSFLSHIYVNTPSRRQSKLLFTIDERGSKIARNSVFDCHCHTGDKWQSKTLFLTTFDLRSSIVLAFSIATYPVW